MVGLISGNACLQVEKEAALKQAESASRAAQNILDSGIIKITFLKDLNKQINEGNLYSNNIG